MERSVAVDPNVSIKLCVAEGRLTVNGWGRDEVRLFINNGSNAGIKVLEKAAASGLPNWIVIDRRADPNLPANIGVVSECLSGESIEMDVPMGASLEVKGRSMESHFDSVKKIYVKNIEGSIVLRNIKGGVNASTYQGDVTVQNSGGAISLESATGNVTAFEVSPGEIGDIFRAKTSSGAISLQNVEHRQIDTNSITGSVYFDGKFLTGGIYAFRTSKGAVRLTIPEDSSCRIVSAFGFGRFESDIELKIQTENITPGGKNIVADMGAGDSCTVNLTTINGSIGVRKQSKPDEPN